MRALLWLALAAALFAGGGVQAVLLLVMATGYLVALLWLVALFVDAVTPTTTEDPR